MSDLLDIDQLKSTLSSFAKIREWEKFHSPKNLSMAIAGEAGELLEIFQWITEQQSIDIKDNTLIREEISYELADIILYIIQMASQLNINLSEAIFNKIKINNKKYPINKVKGIAKKYTEYSNNN